MHGKLFGSINIVIEAFIELLENTKKTDTALIVNAGYVSPRTFQNLIDECFVTFYLDQQLFIIEV